MDPLKLEILIFQAKDKHPLLENVKADFGKGLKEYIGLSEGDETILLARPRVAWLRESLTYPKIAYKKTSESAERNHDPEKRGIMISVVYELT